MKALYFIFIHLYPKLVAIAAIFNPKAKKWIAGRKETWTLLDNFKSKQDSNPLVWIHCASLGEFEQGRPIIETIKHQFPHYQIALSFFSPSGYEVQKEYAFADIVFYLPMDNKTNAKKLITLLKPNLVLFIKYEYWYYYFQQLHKKNIPLVIASAVFRKQQIFFKWYGGFYRTMLNYCTHFFVQENQSLHLLKTLVSADKITLSGDTRFDRVSTIAQNHISNQLIEAFCGEQNTLIAGSTWQTDDKVLSDLVNNNKEIKFIIAPHDISESRLSQCLTIYPNAMLYSEYIKSPRFNNNFNCLIIDNMGMLSHLYYYATIAFIGGGFAGDGVHNVLEAATYGKPVLHGPIYDKYLEAVDLVEAGGSFVIGNTKELEEISLSLLNNKTTYNKASQSAKKYIENKTGATQTIMRYIQENLLFTS